MAIPCCQRRQPGGAHKVCALLLARGADPNSRGEFQRTPLWRASFLGHASLIKPLLQAGCDPRLQSESGETAVHAAPTPQIKEALQGWDVGQTDAAVAAWTALCETQQAAVVAEKRQR
jgi:hypothetical protein